MSRAKRAERLIAAIQADALRRGVPVDTSKCDGCGTVAPLELLDGVPDAHPPRLLCIRCYGPHFCTNDAEILEVIGWRGWGIAAMAWARRTWFRFRGGMKRTRIVTSRRRVALGLYKGTPTVRVWYLFDLVPIWRRRSKRNAC